MSAAAQCLNNSLGTNGEKESRIKGKQVLYAFWKQKLSPLVYLLLHKTNILTLYLNILFIY